MRRFSGGDSVYEKLFETQPRLAAHLSLFGEDVALTEIDRWLERLRFEQLEQREEGNGAPHMLEMLKRFINQPGLLPHQSQLKEITSKGVFFLDGHGYTVPMDQLSDGFRSILCLAFELVRQLRIFFPDDDLFEEHEDGSIVVKPEGVVLIDEIDAHLHPLWQQRIGHWFTRFFPNMQFIVTTHSPLVCRAATKGSIFRLPAPDEDAEPGFVEGEALSRLLYGDILDAYSTEVFGAIAVSEEAQLVAEELAGLNTLAFDRALTAAEEARRESLRRRLPSAKRSETMDRALLEKLEATLQGMESQGS